MLNEKTWKPELLMQLLMSILLCIGFGIIAVNLLLGSAPKTVDSKVLAMIYTGFVMHGGSILCVFVVFRLQKTAVSEFFGFNEGGRIAAIVRGVLAALAYLPLAWLLMIVSTWVLNFLGGKPEAQEAVKILQETRSVINLVGMGLVAVVIAPMAEELIFRGVFYSAIKQAGFPRVAIWGTSLLFALIHNNAASFVSLTVLALILIRLYERTGNLLSCIAAHATFNLVNFAALLLQSNK